MNRVDNLCQKLLSSIICHVLLMLGERIAEFPEPPRLIPSFGTPHDVLAELRLDVSPQLQPSLSLRRGELPLPLAMLHQCQAPALVSLDAERLNHLSDVVLNGITLAIRQLPHEDSAVFFLGL